MVVRVKQRLMRGSVLDFRRRETGFLRRVGEDVEGVFVDLGEKPSVEPLVHAKIIADPTLAILARK